MIFGRPTNLWLGLTTAISGAVAVSLVQLGYDPVTVATLAGAWQGVLGAAILLIANQPPTIHDGDNVFIKTPDGEPNVSVTVSPPLATPDPEPADG